MKVTVTKDDLTGRQTDNAEEVGVIFGDDTFTLDLMPDSREALLALFRDHNREPLRNLLSPVAQAVEVKAQPKKQSGGSEPTGKEINDWLRSVGRGAEVTKGTVSKKLRAEYMAAKKK